MDAIQKYAELKAQIKILEAEMKIIQPEIEELVGDADGGKLATQFGEFKMVYVPKWKYSEKLQEEEALVKEKIKFMKHKEEVDGTAQKESDGGRLVFTSKK